MNRARVFLWGILLLVLGTQTPIFLQMTLTPDTVLYDIQTRCLLEGGVLYRDVVEPNLPGVVWIHALVRSVAGWSPMVLRAFDLIIVLGIALLLSRFVAEPVSGRKQKPVARGILVCGVLLFYFSTSEWCHCQRDTWMLLPCLLATMVRWHILKLMQPGAKGTVSGGLPLHEPGSPAISMNTGAIIGWGLLEGILWGLAFWIKPFVAIPALAVLLGSASLFHCRRAWFFQTGAVILGGAITGGVGISWMVSNACWPHFLEMLTEWNGDYFRSARIRWTMERYLSHIDHFWPWVLIQIPALAVSLREVWLRLRGHLRRAAVPTYALHPPRGASPRLPGEPDADTFRPTGGKNVSSTCSGSKADSLLIAGTLLRLLYSGWIIQAFALQQLFDYIHVPCVILALAVCVHAAAVVLNNSRLVVTAKPDLQLTLRWLIKPVAVAFAALCLLKSPVCRWNREQHWLACARACAGATLESQAKDDLAICPFPIWTELQPMLERIQQLEVPDRSVMAYSTHTIHQYPALQVHPPTRFVFLDTLARCFPRRRPEMVAALEHSGIRYVICNLLEDGWDGDLSGDFILPDSIRKHSDTMFFPYNQTPVFRSGSYVLFEVNQPIGGLTSDSRPLSLPVAPKITSALSRSGTEGRNQ